MRTESSDQKVSTRKLAINVLMLLLLTGVVAVPLTVVVIIGYGMYRMRIDIHQFEESFDEITIKGKTTNEVIDLKGKPDSHFEGNNDIPEFMIYYGPHMMTCRINFNMSHRATSVEVWMK